MVTEKKMSHKTADYRASTSYRQRCGTCSMYAPGSLDKPPSCTLVVQPIYPHDICKYYEHEGEPRAAQLD
jgi:hypothetical protein